MEREKEIERVSERERERGWTEVRFAGHMLKGRNKQTS
jgi:hypothetical protein